MLVVAVILTARPGREFELIEGVRRLVSDARGRRGLRYTKVARRVDDDRVRLLIIGEYESPVDMQRFAAHDEAAAMPLAPLIEAAESSMWEAIDVEFDSDSWRPIFEERGRPTGPAGAADGGSVMYGGPAHSPSEPAS
jgi:hypothetical protein